MACPANTTLASAATNGLLSLDAAALQIAIAQLTCDLKGALTGTGGGGTFTSAEQQFNNAFTLYTFPHGLSVVPKRVYAVMVNKSADLNYAPGMEVDIFSVFSSASGTNQWSVYADATNVYIALREAMPAGAIDTKLTPAQGASGVAPDYTKWNMKVYAAAF